MELFTLFAKQSPNAVFLSIVLGGLAGIGYALLIPTVLMSIDGVASQPRAVLADAATVFGLTVSNYRLALFFVGLCVFVVAARACSQILLSRVALDAASHLRLDAYRRVDEAPIEALERIGTTKLLAALTDDVQRIVMAAGAVPTLIISSVTLVAMLVYLFVLSRDVFRFAMSALVIGTVTYQIPMIIGRGYFVRGQAMVGALYESIGGLVLGAKELKLSQVRRVRYREEILLANEQAVLENRKRGTTIITAAASYGDVLGFFTIGAVTYILANYEPIAHEKLIAVAMALIYIIAPVAAILNALPHIALATVSLRANREFFRLLSREDTAPVSRQPLESWSTVRFRNVSFRYQDGSAFRVGPLDFKLQRGEVTFIVGGNGSGKSSLGKVISLHYPPLEGEVYFGRVRVDRHSVNTCRQAVSAIFADYYLFDRLLGRVSRERQSLVNQYLGELGLTGHVTIERGRFSTRALSQGQRKRLALLVMLLDDRDVYVFDEWAADQDPAFKEFFYRKVLATLKARNKVVVVITHDERYFSCADRIMVMEQGRIAATHVGESACTF